MNSCKGYVEKLLFDEAEDCQCLLFQELRNLCVDLIARCDLCA